MSRVLNRRPVPAPLQPQVDHSQGGDTQTHTPSSSGSYVHYSGPTRHKRYYFDDGNVVIRAQDTLFKVHRYHFAQSPVFSDLLEGTVDQGRTDSDPIFLHDETAERFESMLAVLYMPVAEVHTESGRTIMQSVRHLSNVLKMAEKWVFPRLRTFAVTQLERLPIDPVTRIELSRKYDITSWLFRAYLSLCVRTDAITVGEAERLEMDTALKIWALREEMFKWGVRNREDPPTVKREELVKEGILRAWPAATEGSFSDPVATPLPRFDEEENEEGFVFIFPPAAGYAGAGGGNTSAGSGGGAGNRTGGSGGSGGYPSSYYSSQYPSPALSVSGGMYADPLRTPTVDKMRFPRGG
ncbi:hypothetical protein BOTBODRAFT_51819 [Botryobasidium botryosum FD-172 SS1]|uniref:BTB domain-containing protein n=1 Tax=Botryobasidium botryosum (strain FD-172 SS1) TaxID=930990 RepID=A0A067MUY5_BOTB1|nr:hypothetical protein BOTBODRAFT_51819 [Botryobasidium botryosum FD-172 SS1]